jgi:hypothetical protein
MKDGADDYPLHAIAGRPDPNLQLQAHNLYSEDICQSDDIGRRPIYCACDFSTDAAEIQFLVERVKPG